MPSVIVGISVMTKFIMYLIELQERSKHIVITTRAKASLLAFATFFTVLFSVISSVYNVVVSGGVERIEAFLLGAMCAAAGVLFCSVFLYLRRRIGRIAENFHNITSLLLAKKLNETAVSIIAYAAIGWLAFGFSRGDISLLIVSVAFAQILTFAITFYRVFSGRFGYNALEMKEILKFISSSSNKSIPPYIGGLRGHPDDSIIRKVSSADIQAPGVRS